MTTDNLAELSELGVSIWLDDLARGRLTGEGPDSLGHLIAQRHVVGVTTNPSIFANAVADGTDYDAQLGELAAGGATVEQAVARLTTDDVRDACDLFAPVAQRTDGVDGRVSIEVDPFLARDSDETTAQVEQLWSTVDRPNLFVKIPATVEGLPAIRASLARGYSINVTLIFSLDRYRAVAQAYIDGLEEARDAGVDLATIHSVASFFVSRIDAAVDSRLDRLDTPEARAVRGEVALANARLAHQAYEEIFSGERWADLAAAGARPQRLLWASTSTKDESFRPTRYVEELVTAGVVNTMPAQTITDTAELAQLRGDTVRGRYEDAADVLVRLELTGVHYEDVMTELEDEGIEKFEDSWRELGETVARGMRGTDKP